MEDTAHNKVTTSIQDFQDFMGKFNKLFKLQNDGLTPPTFAQAISDQLTDILMNIKSMTTQNKSVKPHDFVTFIAPFVQQIVELSQQNFLQRTLRDFQINLTTLIRMASELADTFPQNSDKTIVNRIFSLLQSLVPKALLISYNKAAPSAFTSIQQTMHSVQSDLLLLQENPLSQTYEKFSEILHLSNVIEGRMKHIIAAHSFVGIAESLQDSLRKFIIAGSVGFQHLTNSVNKLHPLKPKIDVTNEKTASEYLDEFMASEGSDQEKKEQFIDNFQQAISKEMRIENRSEAIESLLQVVIKISPPKDTRTSVFYKFEHFIICAAQCLTQLYKLPKSSSSRSDVLSFLESVDALKTSAAEMSNIHVRPEDWTDEDMALFSSSIKPMTNIASILGTSMNLIQKANEKLGKTAICASLSRLLPLPVSARFVIEEPLASAKLRRFNVIRALACITKNVEALEEKGIMIKHQHDSEPSDAIHPVDFSGAFNSVRNAIDQIELKLFFLSLNKYNDFPVAKTGVTMLSLLAELSKRLEEFILSMHSVSLEVSGVRELSMILFDQSLPHETEPLFNEMIQNIHTVFEVYEVYEQLHYAGAADVSLCAQLSFLATMSATLAPQWPALEPFAEYFKSINLFDINTDEVIGKIAYLKSLVIRLLIDWKCDDFISKFMQDYKSVCSCITIIRKEQLDPVASRLLAQLGSWLSNLQRTSPKLNNLREMNVRMAVLKDMLAKFLSDHPDCQSASEFGRIYQAVDLMREMNNSFLSRMRLKILLTFIERIDTGAEPPPPLSPPDVPVVEHPVPQKEQVAEEEEEKEVEAHVLEYTPKEKLLWRSFADTTFNAKKVPVRQQFPTYTNDLIHSRARDLFEEFKKELPDKSFFEPELTAVNEALSQTKYTENSLSFPEFNEKIFITLESFIDKLTSILNELNPPSKGRGYPREIPAHRNGQQINEIGKKLGLIRRTLRNADFMWLSDLIHCRTAIHKFLKVSETGSDFGSPYMIVRKLALLSFATYKLGRCMSIVKGQEQATYEYDLKMLKSMISDLLERSRIVRENSPLLYHEITEIINNRTENTFSDLISTFKVFCRSRAIFDVKELVSSVDAPFFNWPEYFKKLPQDYSSLTSFLNSETYEKYANYRMIISKFVESDFSDEFINENMRSLLKFKIEVSQSPFQINWDKTDESVSNLFALQELVDISIAIDRVYPLVQHQKQQTITGTCFLSIELLLYELQILVEALVETKPSILCGLYLSLSKVLAALRSVHSKFGPRKPVSQAFDNFVDSWKNFLCEVGELPMSEFREQFRKSSSIILNVIQDGAPDEAVRDSKCIEYLMKEFEMLPSKELALKLVFAFQFVSNQPRRFVASSSSTESIFAAQKANVADLPFYQVISSLKAIIAMYSIREIIPQITKKLNTSFSTSVEDIVPRFNEVNVSAECEEEKVEESKVLHFDKQLSMFDQTALVEMTAAIQDANIADGEKIIMRDILRKKVEYEEEILASCEADISDFEAINQSMRKLAEVQTPQPSNKVQKENEIDALRQNEERSREAEQKLSENRKKFNDLSSEIILQEQTKLDLESSLKAVNAKAERVENATIVTNLDKRVREVIGAEEEWDKAMGEIFSRK